MSKKLLKDRWQPEHSWRCPVCDTEVFSAAYRYFGDEAVIPIYSCESCSFLFSRPLMIPSLDERQMDSLTDAELLGSPLLKELHHRMYLSKEIRLVKKHSTCKPSLLDVGCGSGWVSAIWNQNGFEVTGLEPSDVRSRYAREKYGINVINGYLENSRIKNSYDVALLRHVIEHFESPREAMIKVREAVRSDGLVVVVVPNIDCIGKKLFGADWEWVLPWHCNFFNPKSLATLFDMSGFEIIKMYQTASPLYYPESLARKTGLAGLHKFIRRHRLTAMMAMAPLALLGAMSGNGDNLTVIAKVNSKS